MLQKHAAGEFTSYGESLRIDTGLLYRCQNG